MSKGSIQPIARTTLSQSIIEQLSSLIVEGRLEPGERLASERDLASQFGVARGALREAERALALIGLLTITPGKGVFVAQKRPLFQTHEIEKYLGQEIHNVREVYEVREIIESRMIEIAAERIDSNGVSDLEKHMKRMYEIAKSEHPNHKAFAESHFLFDLVVAEAAGNRLLTEIFKSIRDVELETHLKVLRLPGTIANSLRQHERILVAIRSKSRLKAREAAKRHFDAAKRTIDHLLIKEASKKPDIPALSTGDSLSI
jgi:GntR family transcriptional repressor for pyruvate dehydrogenase complex